MDERRLQIFRTVAEVRNFSRAAGALHLSQPTVSQQIQQLEEYYGVRLLDRPSPPVALTAAGRALYAHLGPLLEQMAEVRRAVVRADGAVAGQLTVGASLTIGEYVLPEVLAGFLRDHPGVESRVQLHNTERIASLVQAGQLDIGLVEGPLAAGDLVEEPFLADELVLICPPDHPWRARRVITPADLKAERLILREPGSGTRQALEECLRSVGLRIDELHVASELAGTEAIKGAVEAGMGVSAISEWTVRKEVLLGTLIVRRLGNCPMRRVFRAVWPRGRTLVPTAEALLQALKSSPSA